MQAAYLRRDPRKQECEGDWEGEATGGDHPCGHLGATSWENSGKWFTEILRGALLPGARRLGIYPPASLGDWVGALPGVRSVSACGPSNSGSQRKPLGKVTGMTL